MLDEFRGQRERMVVELVKQGYLRSEKIIKVFNETPRHLFVREEDRNFAYADYPVPILAGQTISAPHMVAIMTEVLGINEDDIILEIGTGSGYQTAILAELGKEVYTIERIKTLHYQAKKLLDKLGYKNISCKASDGTLGWKAHAPYDCIIVTAAAPDIPDALFEQLAPGGRMAVPVGEMHRQDLKLVMKTEEGGRTVINRGGCIFVPLIGKHGWKHD